MTEAPLRHGERMSQAEFQIRDELMPEKPKWELVGGVAYQGAAEVLDRHAAGHAALAAVLGAYSVATPWVKSRIDVTVVLGPFGQTRPDLLARLPISAGGRSSLDDRGRIIGGPELVIEIADASEPFDLGPKRQDYRRGGVLEYVVLCMDSDRLCGFDLPSDAERVPDADGIWRSGVFPGLWIDLQAALDDNLTKLLATVHRGISSPEHAEFAERLAAARKR